MKAYVTKYALTKGIFEVEADPSRSDAEYFKVEGYIDGFFLDKGIHLTRLDAVCRAKEMRRKKITNLERQLKKLKEMRFE